MPDPVRLPEGSMAPDVELPDADGRPVRLASLRTGGARLIVFCYPAAGTPGCTTEATDFRDRAEAFAAAGYRLVGISPDSPAKLAKFRDAQRLPFPLLSDPDHEALAAFGAWGEKVLYGRRSQGVIRSTIVLNGDGTVAASYYGVRAKGHVDRLARDLGVADPG